MKSYIKIKEEIIKKVDKNRDEIINFLQKLIQINSETGKEFKIQQFIANFLRQINVKVDEFIPEISYLKNQPGFVPIEIDFKDRPNVVGIIKGSGGGRSILLNGHVDTITAEPIEAWDVNPFSGKIVDGKIFGRGSSDMKSGVAAMIMAVKYLRELEVSLRGSIIMEHVVDEEFSGYGTLACLAKGYTADAGICCETSDLHIQPACIGRLWFYIDVIGKTSSISNKWTSISAIEKGMKIVEAINDLEQIRLRDLTHSLYPDNRGALPCMVCVFKSGNFPSAIPERARLEGSMGTMPYEKVDEVKRQLEDYIGLVAKVDPWMRKFPPRVSFRPTGGYGAEIPINSPIVSTITKAFQEINKVRPVINGRLGGSDTKYLINYGKIPTVIFGPGNTSQMHAINEYVEIENVIRAVKTIALTVYEWCK